MRGTRTQKDRRRLRRSSAIAGVGDGVVAAALPLLAVDLTRDPVAISLVVAAQHLPWVLVRLLWPRLKIDRRTVVGAVDTLRALTLGWLGVLAAAGHDSMRWIELTAFVVGLGEALTDGTESETSDVAGLSARAMVGMAVLGLPLGGILFEVFPAVPFLFAVLAFAGAALFALLVGRPVVAPAHDGSWLEEELPHPPITVVAAAAVASFAAAMVAGILVLYAHDDLGLGAPAFGFLLAGLAACTAVGAVATPMIGERLGVRRALVLALLVAAAGHGMASRVASTDRPIFGAMALGVTAAAAMVASVLFRATAGRNIARLHLAVWTAIPIGALAGGELAKRRTVRDVLAWSAAAFVVAAIIRLTPSGGS